MRPDSRERPTRVDDHRGPLRPTDPPATAIRVAVQAVDAPTSPTSAFVARVARLTRRCRLRRGIGCDGDESGAAQSGDVVVDPCDQRMGIELPAAVTKAETADTGHVHAGPPSDNQSGSGRNRP